MASKAPNSMFKFKSSPLDLRFIAAQADGHHSQPRDESNFEVLVFVVVLFVQSSVFIMKLVGSILAGAAALFATSANAEVYMKETFEDAEWESRWTVGTEWKPTSETGEWKWMTPQLQEDNKAIQTGEDARFYSLTAPLDAEINNGKNWPAVVLIIVLTTFTIGKRP